MFHHLRFIEAELEDAKGRLLMHEEEGNLLDNASYLTAFCAWDSSPHLPVTPAQLMRPGM